MLGAVDLTDLDMWARAVPYDEFGRLRQEAPVAWSPDEGSGFWPVTRYADIVAASRDVTTSSSARGVSFEEPTDRFGWLWQCADSFEYGAATMSIAVEGVGL
jgi:cytochrome P450